MASSGVDGIARRAERRLPRRRPRTRLPLRARHSACGVTARPAIGARLLPGARARPARDARPAPASCTSTCATRDNILVGDDGTPSLLDFQSCLGTRWMPPPLRRFVERIDLAAIYKHWAKRSPDTMGAGPHRRARQHEPAAPDLGAARVYWRRAARAGSRGTDTHEHTRPDAQGAHRARRNPPPVQPPDPAQGPASRAACCSASP